MKKYKLFRFTSRNTGYHSYETDSLSRARSMAKNLPKTRIDGPYGFFELYENGVVTEASSVASFA